MDNAGYTELARSVFEILSTHPWIRKSYGSASDHVALAVFGRYCPLLPRRVAELIGLEDPGHVVCSGNVGKDSGPLPALGIAEAHYVLSSADMITGGKLFNGGKRKIGIDLTATDGIENAEAMVRWLSDAGITPNTRVLVVAHSTSMLRLGLVFQRAVETAGLKIGRMWFEPTKYKPAVGRQLDQWEIFFELHRLAMLDDEGRLTAPDIGTQLLREVRAALGVITQELAQQGIDVPSTAGLPSL